jgi:hypothetical protein
LPCNEGTRRCRLDARETHLSVPLAARETAEGDQADHDDDQSDPKAPKDHQHDPDDDDDSACRYPGDSASIVSVSHALLLQPEDASVRTQMAQCTLTVVLAAVQ